MKTFDEAFSVIKTQGFEKLSADLAEMRREWFANAEWKAEMMLIAVATMQSAERDGILAASLVHVSFSFGIGLLVGMEMERE